jgi:hypothetical protein
VLVTARDGVTSRDHVFRISVPIRNLVTDGDDQNSGLTGSLIDCYETLPLQPHKRAAFRRLRVL